MDACIRPLGCLCPGKAWAEGCPYYNPDGTKVMAPKEDPKPATPGPFGGDDDILTILAKVNAERAGAYGTPEDNFARVARHWTVYFLNKYGVELEVTPTDVALLMDLMKTARLENMPSHRDSWVDKAGYARCGAAIEANLARYGRKPK